MMAPDSVAASNTARIVAVIPAFDPGQALVPLAAGLVELGLEVVVVDDGSGDGARPIIDAVAGLDGVRVLHHAINYGKGAALKTAFRELVVQRPAVDAVITLAADGRHQPEDVAALATVLRRKPQAFVLGVRRRMDSLSPGRRLLKRVMELAFGLRTGCQLHDLQTGLRGLPRDLVLEVMTVHANRYEFDVCLLRRGVAWGREVIEVPIRTTYGERHSSSRFRPLRDSIGVFASLLGRLERH